MLTLISMLNYSRVSIENLTTEISGFDVKLKSISGCVGRVGEDFRMQISAFLKVGLIIQSA